MTSYQSKTVVLGRAWANAVLAAYKVAPLAELVDTAKIRLSTDPAFNPTPDSIPGDLDAFEADFSGYTAGGYAVVLSAPVVLGTNIMGVVVGALPIMATASPLVTNSVYGYWMDDGVNLIAAERFADEQIALFGAVGAYLDLLVAIPFNLIQAAR